LNSEEPIAARPTVGEGVEQRCKFEKLQWNMAQQRAFRRLKEALTEAAVLTQLDLDTPSTIGTDSSIGASHTSGDLHVT